MKLLKCNVCGNLIELIEGSNENIVCCNEVMNIVTVNSTEASGEKHVPIYEILDNKIKVSVGSVIHPMEENHYIKWIALVSEKKTIKKYLKPGENPVVKFPYIQGSTIYAYCNLHSIFKTDVE